MFQANEKIKHMNILLTGGCGFIGSNIAEHLLTNGVKHVRILDNLSTGKKENIQPFINKYGHRIEFMYGDITNLETCRKAMKNMNVVCHQGALGSVPRSIEDPLNSHMSNINGFLNILLSAKEEGIKRIVYASSSSVYGDHPVLPKVEENMGNVLSPYACTKAVNELYANVFCRCYDLECIGLRYFNIFGPRQDPNGAYAAVIPKFIMLMMNGKCPTINGDGSFSRDFTYVENAIQANMLAMTTDNINCFGTAFNIGAGGQTNLNELVEAINKSLHCKLNVDNTNNNDTTDKNNNKIYADIYPIYGENRQGDIPHSNANIEKAQTMMGYNPLIDFNTGIDKLIEHEVQNV